jgi:glycosyltransferase involved in cell wall biosynthesis
MPMRSVIRGQWNKFGYAFVWYEGKRRMRVCTAARLLMQTRPELVYFNSLFDYRFTVLPLLVTRILFPRVPIVLAPRGELSAGALVLKRRKKRVFVAAFRFLKLHKALAWHASTGLEKADIERVFGSKINIHIAIDLRYGLMNDGAGQISRSRKYPVMTSLVFFSRIVPKKNLKAVIQAALLAKSPVSLCIAGPIEDAKYWNDCQKLISRSSCARPIDYVGTVPADEVVSFLGNFDLLVLPTYGENFGHVVLESLAAGTPAIVGNDTPWQVIESSGAGWMCDPDKPGAIAELIDNFVSLDETASERMRASAAEFASRVINDPSAIEANRLMFNALTLTRRVMN